MSYLRCDQLKNRAHKKYLLRFLDDFLPSFLASSDTTRMTLAFFTISGLDVLKALDSISDEKKQNIIEWIYMMQVTDEVEKVSGFQGSSTFSILENRGSNAMYKWSHLAGTYCALCTLVILGDDLSRVNRKAIIESLRTLQLPNGCFTAAKEGTESDMRFLFCAASICYILDDFTGMDIKKAAEFIKNSISYDGGIAQGPGLESHGGSSYCAIATLALNNHLNYLSNEQLEYLKKWLIKRQQDGFQGRPNKPVDTCYSFWIGAALKILNGYNLINFDENKLYVLATQNDIIGGFSKWIDGRSDPLHTYLGLAGLSLMKDDSLNEVNPILNITYRAHEHLKEIHKKWKSI